MIDALGQAESAGTPPRSPYRRGVELIDVWSWTASVYRVLAICFLVFNVLTFLALGCFIYHLRTGDLSPLLRPFVSLFSGDVAPPRYAYGDLFRACFNPFSPRQVTLTDFVTFPINVEQVPAQIVIVGLLVATLIAIPILVTMLYRLPVAMIFLAIVGFVGVFPWLALTLLLSCYITTLRPFRFSFRYATFLIALTPVIIYFFFATRDPSSDILSMLGPTERMKLYAPWVLALIASCLGGGIVLAFAHVINYRPGGIALLLAVLFAVPVTLFYTQVGADELAYRLLEQDYGPDSIRVFVDMDTRELVQRAAEKEWIADEHKDSREIRAIIENKMVLLNVALPTELVKMQREVVDACDRFNARYPESRYYWNCLYLRGRALDMRIDMELLRREALLQFYADFPTEASRETWAELLANQPESPFASVAGLKLAILLAREGKLRLAHDLLVTVVNRFSGPGPLATTVPPEGRQDSSPAPADDNQGLDPLEKVVEKFGDGRASGTTSAPASGLLGLLTPKPSASTLSVDAQAVAEQAAQLLSLFRENQAGQIKDLLYPDNNPISLLLRCDPRHSAYPENIRHIDQWFPGNKLHDNLMLRLALTEHDVDARRRKLREVANRYPDGDAAPHAIYELGIIEFNQNHRDAGRRQLEDLLKRYPESSWSASARRKLLSLATTTGVK